MHKIDADNKPSTVILDGLARSGTTFSAAVINSLPNVFFITDTFRLPRYYQEMHGLFRYPKNLLETRKITEVDFGKAIPSIDSFMNKCVYPVVKTINRQEESDLFIEDLKKRLTCHHTVSYIDCFTGFYESLSKIFKKNIVGGKTTYCFAYKAQMLANIPNLKWIDIIRDIRGVYSSGKVTGHHTITNIMKYNYWKRNANFIRKNEADVPKDRYFLLRYEDLVLKKRETVQKLADFLELDSFSYEQWEKQPILKNDGTPFGSNSSYDKSGNAIKDNIYNRRGQAFEKSPVVRWQKNLSNSEKWFLTTMHRYQLTYLGYSTDRYTPTDPRLIALRLKSKATVPFRKLRAAFNMFYDKR